MIILRLAAGGCVAVRPEDVVVAQRSPWGSLIQLASTGAAFELEYSLPQVAKLLPHLNFDVGDTIFDPRRIVSVWEDDDQLSYVLDGGLTMRQTGADLFQLLEALETQKAHLAAQDAGGKS